MNIKISPRLLSPLHALAVLLLLLCTGDGLAQHRPPTIGEFLKQFKGREVFVMDKTTGLEQFTSGDANKTYCVVLDDVLTDHIIVRRNTDTDRRTFLYPLSVIRRIIFENNGKPYEKIVIEMY